MSVVRGTVAVSCCTSTCLRPAADLAPTRAMSVSRNIEDGIDTQTQPQVVSNSLRTELSDECCKHVNFYTLYACSVHKLFSVHAFSNRISVFSSLSLFLSIVGYSLLTSLQNPIST